MPKTDRDPLGPGFEWRLRHALDRVQPRHSSPRYQSAATPAVRSWRLAPAALALALVGVLAMSAYAATGSANPAVWTRQAVTVIQSAGHAPAGGSESQPAPLGNAAHPTPPAGAGQGPALKPSPRPEPSESPEPSSSPEPSESADPNDSAGHGGSDGSDDGRDSGGSGGSGGSDGSGSNPGD